MVTVQEDPRTCRCNDAVGCINNQSENPHSQGTAQHFARRRPSLCTCMPPSRLQHTVHVNLQGPAEVDSVDSVLQPGDVCGPHCSLSLNPHPGGPLHPTPSHPHTLPPPSAPPPTTTHTRPPPPMSTHPSACVPEGYAQDVGVLCAVDPLNALIAGVAHSLHSTQHTRKGCCDTQFGGIS